MPIIDLPAPKIFSVTEINRSIKGLLETEFSFVNIAGEISNLRKPYSGHLYFTLKDETSQLKAVMFKPQQRYLAALPEEGLQVVCRGRISIYEPRGDYQLIVDFMEFTGDGALQLAFERLKKRLASEGLFDQEQKKDLPSFPEHITLITSPSGAAVHDFLTVANDRFPGLAIEIFPVRVQGEQAAPEIVKALAETNQRAKSAVIVLCRGGGSLEDLWPFNEESVARAIQASKIPVVSAVGHEIDFTIADFAADRRAPTPTAAAELVVPNRTRLSEQIQAARSNLQKKIKHLLSHHRLRLEMQTRMLGDPRALLPHFRLRLDRVIDRLGQVIGNDLDNKKNRLARQRTHLHQHNPALRLRHKKQWLNELKRRLPTLARARLAAKQRELQQATALLEAVNPLAVLGRGFAVIRNKDDKNIIRAAHQTTKGQDLEVLLDQGELECQVTKIKKRGVGRGKSSKKSGVT